MTVPRTLILDRLNQNIDNLAQVGEKFVRGLFLSEIYSPFQSTGKSGEASPFLKSLYPEIRIAAMLERSLNTALGWGWDKVARDIAIATHGNGEVGHFVTGQVPAATTSAIDAMCMAYTSGGGHSRPDTDEELGTLLPSLATPGAREEIREKDDVFYIAKDGTENHIEMKTPKPNYDQLRAAKRRILRVHVARHPTKIRAFVGLPYNPNGYFGPYGWPTTPFFLDLDDDMMLGKAFWNYVGDSETTYDELLDCFLTVAKDRRDQLTNLLEAVD